MDNTQGIIEELKKLKPIIKLNYFCKRNNIPQATLSKVLSNDAFKHNISYERLNRLYYDIVTTLEDII